jgi:hypothetical protein
MRIRIGRLAVEVTRSYLSIWRYDRFGVHSECGVEVVFYPFCVMVA